MQLKSLENYRAAVGGGNTSAELSNALVNGLVPGIKKFADIAMLDAIKAMNAMGVSHQDIPLYTLLFTVANPLVASLISNPSTLSLGLAAAKTPVLAAAWDSGEGGGGGVTITLEPMTEADYEAMDQDVPDVGPLLK